MSPLSEHTETHPPASHRSIAIDVGRGLAISLMPTLWIMREVWTAAPSSFLGRWGYALFNHSSWHGHSLADGVLPFFITIIGASQVASIDRLRAASMPRHKILLRMIRRILIFAILCYLLGAGETFPYNPQFVGQYPIDLMMAMLISCVIILFTGFRTQLLLFFAFLAAHTAAIEYARYHYSIRCFAGFNLNCDRALREHFVRWLFQLLAPAHTLHSPIGMQVYQLTRIYHLIGTSIFGIFIGMLCRPTISSLKRILILATLALIGMGAGNALEIFMPINKPMWTPPFTVFSAGHSCMLLLIPCVIAERWRLQPFTWIFTTLGQIPFVSWTIFITIPFPVLTSQIMAAFPNETLGRWGGLARCFLDVIIAVSACAAVHYFFRPKARSTHKEQ